MKNINSNEEYVDQLCIWKIVFDQLCIRNIVFGWLLFEQLFLKQCRSNHFFSKKLSGSRALRVYNPNYVG